MNDPILHALAQFPWPFVTAALTMAFGMCIGSFLNVCIYRIPLDMSLSRPRRSFCPHCETQIAWYDNIPVLSFLLLGGRCRHCQASIRLRYILVEALTGVLFTLVWLKFCPVGDRMFLGLAPVTDVRLVPVYWLAVGGLILGSFVDFEHLIIPDRITLGGIAAGLILSAAVPALHGAESALHGLTMGAIGAAAGWGLLWGIALFGRFLFKKEAMGFGDVKLMGAIGAFFGWRSVLAGVMISSLAGSLVGIALILAGRKKMQSKIPFGPYLALAALVWLLWGPALWNAYLNLLAPAQPGVQPLY